MDRIYWDILREIQDANEEAEKEQRDLRRDQEDCDESH